MATVRFNLQMAGNDVGNQIDATTLGLIETLDKWNGNGIWLDFTQKCFAEVRNELMWHDEDEYVGILAGVN